MKVRFINGQTLDVDTRKNWKLQVFHKSQLEHDIPLLSTVRCVGRGLVEARRAQVDVKIGDVARRHGFTRNYQLKDFVVRVDYQGGF